MNIPYDCWCTYANEIPGYPATNIETLRITTNPRCKLHGDFAQACKRYNREAPDAL